MSALAGEMDNPGEDSDLKLQLFQMKQIQSKDNMSADDKKSLKKIQNDIIKSFEIPPQILQQLRDNKDLLIKRTDIPFTSVDIDRKLRALVIGFESIETGTEYKDEITDIIGNTDYYIQQMSPIVTDAPCPDQFTSCENLMGGQRIGLDYIGTTNHSFCSISTGVLIEVIPFVEYTKAILTAGHCLDHPAYDEIDVYQSHLGDRFIGNISDTQNETDCDCALLYLEDGNPLYGYFSTEDPDLNYKLFTNMRDPVVGEMAYALGQTSQGVPKGIVVSVDSTHAYGITPNNVLTDLIRISTGDTYTMSGDSGGTIYGGENKDQYFGIISGHYFSFDTETYETEAYVIGSKWSRIQSRFNLYPGPDQDFNPNVNATGCGSDNVCSVFATNSTFSGDMNQVITGKRGISAADMMCSSAAYDAGLEGSYLTWISANRSNDPITRFDFSQVPYELTDGTHISIGSDNLLSGDGLLAPINTDEFGDSLANSGTNTAWTNVQNSGLSVNLPARENCNGWINRSPARRGNFGLINSSAATAWTDSGTISCQSNARLYCFEQDEEIATSALIEQNGQVVIQAENFNLFIEGESDDWRFKDSMNGFTGSGYMESGFGFNNFYGPSDVLTGPELVYYVDFQTTGTYYIWVRGCGDTGKDDSIHMGLNREFSNTSSNIRIPEGCNSFEWMNKTYPFNGRPSLEITNPGTYKINLWAREDGAKIDKILLTTDSSFDP